MARKHLISDANPMGTDGFEFVEFASSEPQAMTALFEQLGFTAIARHRSKNVMLFRQGDINFILNAEPSGQAARFRQVHGPSANAMAFRVGDARAASSGRSIVAQSRRPSPPIRWNCTFRPLKGSATALCSWSIAGARTAISMTLILNISRALTGDQKA